MVPLIVIFAVLALSVFIFAQRTSSLRTHRLVELGLIIALATVGFLYLDLFVRDGYTRNSLAETQEELRELVGLFGHELSPSKLATLAGTQGLQFKRMQKFLHASIPSGSSAYRCGRLTCFFDANGKLVDVRGHLLDHSFFDFAQPNKPDHRTPDPLLLNGCL